MIFYVKQKLLPIGRGFCFLSLYAIHTKKDTYIEVSLLVLNLEIQFNDACFSCCIKEYDEQWSNEETENAEQFQTDEHRNQSR